MQIHKVFSNVFGWIIAVFTAYLSWLGNDSGSILLVVVALVWDMTWGIAAAVKRHNFVLSYLLRETFCKIIVYVGAMSIVLFAERMLGTDIGAYCQDHCSYRYFCGTIFFCRKHSHN